MNIIRSCFAGLLALMGVDAMSSPASATWLGLADGTYNVTLSCVTSSVIPCPSTIGGTMTIAGAGATAFDFAVNGQAFVGVPTNGTFTGIFGTDEFSFLDLSPFSSLSLQNFLTGSFPGLSPQSWVYCNNFSPASCTPATEGNWTAAAVPEPPGLALFVLGLGIMTLAGGIGRGRQQGGAVGR
jgi:hypothetical protein